MRRLFIVSGVLLLTAMALPRAAYAQAVEVPELVTDRPDFTESSEVIFKGGLQFESGVSFEGEGAGIDRARSFTAPAALLRIGLGHSTELRISGDGLLSQTVGSYRQSGFSDVELGAKFKLFNQDRVGFDMAILPMVSVPIGADGFTSGTYDPTVKLTWGRDLAAGFGLTGNVNWSSLSDEAGRFDQKAVSLSLGHDLFAGWGMYAEAFGFSRLERDGGRAITVNGGVSHGLGDRMQFDIEAGHGVTQAAPDWFVGFGFAVRSAVRR